MIEIYKKTLKFPKIQKIEQIEKGTWIRINEPTEAELKMISEKLKLDMTILEDGMDENEISRVENEDGIFYMIIRFPLRRNGLIATVPILFVVSQDHILTLCREKENITKNIAERDKDFLTSKKTYFVLRTISEIFKSYDFYLHSILKDLKTKKIKINNLDNKDILFLVQEEETLTDFISSLTPAINVMEKILRGKHLTIYETDKDIMEDLVWDSKQTLELSSSGLKSIKNIREAYSAILTNDLNKVMKVLTITTIFLTLPTVISSIFGMNIPLPLQNNPSAFVYVTLFTLFLFLIILIIVKRKKWL
jgi:magnesium transporter